MNASSRRNNSNSRNKATGISMITGMQATEKIKLATAMMQPTARMSAKEGRPWKKEKRHQHKEIANVRFNSNHMD
jgi:hypothetical protein